MFLAYKWATFYDPTCRVLPLKTYSFLRIQKFIKKFGFIVVRRIPVLFPIMLLAPAIVIEARKEDQC
jgi:hypothetical protein